MLKRIINFFSPKKNPAQPPEALGLGQSKSVGVNTLATHHHVQLIEKHKILILSQDDALKFIPLASHETVIIRISAPGNVLPPLKGGYSDVMECRFNDLNSALSDEETKLSRSYKEIKNESFRLLSFISMYLDKTIVVHCEVGQSRSAGVAQFILELRGDVVGEEFIASFPDIWDPNYWVLTALRDQNESQKN